MSKENLVEYLGNKKSELKDLRLRDALLAKAVADIHRHTKQKEIKYVPLSLITPIHCIDREAAINKVKERASILMEHKQELKKIKKLNKQTLLQYLPSISGIKVIKDDNDHYISFEGNGRVEAFKQVFDLNDDIQLEVEEYVLDDYEKVLRRVNRVRTRNFPDT
ncbi:MAG: hypothetical protein ACPHLK_02275 [Gammaproteobacteria bacterium]|jgi:hypothetical protein